MTTQAERTSADVPTMTSPRGVAAPDRRAWSFHSVAGGLLTAASSLVLFLGGWAVISIVIGRELFPPPPVVFRTLGEMIADGTLLESIGVSVTRIGAGYVGGLVVGITGGVVLARVRLLDRVLTPIISLARMVPPTAIIPLAIIWLGIGEQSKYFVVFWGCVLVIFINTYDGITRVPQTRIWAAQCLGSSPAQITRGVVLPSAVPQVWTGARAALGLAFMSVVAAEMIGAKSGIGYLIMQARVLVQTDQMFVGLLTLAVVGLIVDLMFNAVGRRLIWRYIDFYEKS